MASNQGRKRLDQPAGNTLTALDRVLADLVVQHMTEDEFTAEMVYKKRPDMTLSTLNNRLGRQVEMGRMTKRCLLINGRKTNVYRYATQ